MLPAALVAQAPVNRVMHVWVDPHNGDDAAPLDWNPGPSILTGNRCSVTDTHPNNVVNGSAPLLHAAAPFRTVTAAISYLTSIQTVLPHFNSVTGVTTSHAIIHCLPGVYGPGTGTEQHTGLLFNGETFPIRLPGRVSVQGASAMNTVFIADGDAPIFEFGSTGNLWPTPIEEGVPRQFVANVGLTGAIREQGYARPSVPSQGAAIHFASEVHANVLVTNCFLYCNAVGILLDAPLPPSGGTEPYQVEHVLHLAHNTFTWNVCGIWNGQFDTNASPSATNASTGQATICAVNNLFDSFVPQQSGGVEIPLPLPGSSRGLPTGGSWDRWQQSVSSTGTVSGVPLFSGLRMTNFEGVTAADVEDSSGVNYNGFESVAYNLNVGLLTPAIDQLTFLGLHQTSPRTSNPATPSRNVGAITGNPSGPRGILYVRDLIHEGARNSGLPFFVPAGGSTQGEYWDVCVGDFRLSPGTRFHESERGTPPSQLNPMVDAGHHLLSSVTMGNGLTLELDVFSDLGNGTFPHQPTRWDAEGFGNEADYDYPFYPNRTIGGSSLTCTRDLGADSLDQLLIAGYRSGSTHFYWRTTSGGTLNTAQTNDFAWWLCPTEGLSGASSSTTVPAATGLYTPVHTDYLPTAAWQLGAPTYYLPSYVDVIPHLLPDIHPWWSNAPHPIASNVFWQPCLSGLTNLTLYTDPSVGIIHPTGCYEDLGLGTSAQLEWLDYDLLVAASGIYPGVVPNLVRWMNEPGTNPPNTINLENSVAATGGWCYLQDPGSSVTWLRPTQNPRFTTNDNAMRTSTECLGSEVPFPVSLGGGAWRTQNLQTFIAFRDGGE